MWEQIRANQQKTLWLITLMGLLFCMVGYAFGYYLDPNAGWLGLTIAFGIWLIQTCLAYYFGPSLLLLLNGAHKVSPTDAPRLYNIVEEMKIASGLSRMPEVYVLDRPDMNAFAVGNHEEQYAIVVTSALLAGLSRDELQGVIGHEIAHLKNQDSFYLVMMMTMLGTIILLAEIFHYTGQGSFGWTRTNRSSEGNNSKNGGIAALIGIGLILVMILSPILTRLIYWAISRQREYLADASSVQYTRYPLGLAQALQTISNASDAHQTPSKNANPNTDSAIARWMLPFYIVNPQALLTTKRNQWTSTHPPIQQRIDILKQMAHADLNAYQTAYASVTQRQKPLISSHTLNKSTPLDIRSPQTLPDGDIDPIQRHRQTTQMLWQLNGYQTIECTCGTVLKIPPDFPQSSMTCPTCQTQHNLSALKTA